MAHATLGRKQRCASCGIKFYDLKKSPAVCPSCGTEFDPESLLKSRRGRAAAKDETVKAPAKSEGDEAEDDLIEKSEDDDAFESDDDVLSSDDGLLSISSDDDEDEADATGSELIDVLDDEMDVDAGSSSDENEDDI